MKGKTNRDTLTYQELFFGLSASIDAFQSANRLRKLRPATLQFYQNELSYFLDWAAAAGLESLDDLTPQTLRAYFEQLSTRRKTPNSLHCAYRAVKTWLNWSWEEYQMDQHNPMDRVQVESPDSSPRPGIPLEDVEALLDSVSHGRHPKRDRALFLFFLDTGIRRAELVRLNVSDLNRDGSVTLQPTTTKTRVPRRVYLVTDTRRALSAYLRERGELFPGDPLFATDAGRRFTPNGLYEVLRRRIKDARISPAGYHAFRRTFALETRRAGAGEIETSRLLGHGKNAGNLDMTRRYLDFDDDDLRAAHDENSPVKRLKKQRKPGKKNAGVSTHHPGA